MRGIILSLLLSSPLSATMMIAPHQTFNPFQLNGTEAAFDADREANFTITETSVSTWNDLSANANHLSQGTGSAMPVRVSTDILNNRYAVIFDGSDVLSAANVVGVDGVPAYTIYFVMNRIFTSGNRDAFYLVGSTVAYRQRWVPTNNAVTWLSQSGPDSASSSRSWGNISEYHVRKAGYNGSAQTWCMSGACDSDALSGAIADNINPDMYLGDSPAAGNHIGGIAMVLIYNRVLTSAEEARFNSYFAMKYGSSVTLP